jgi:hypothetical protein
LLYFRTEKTQIQAHFPKIPIQNIGSNLYGKNKKTASTEMDFIQKRRKILRNCDQRFKDENPIFLTSINMSQKVQEILTFLTSKMVKNGQNRDFLPIHGQFFSN